MCGAAYAADSQPAHFTLTRTLPDGRKEVRQVTLEELQAMTQAPAAARAAPAASAPQTPAAPSPKTAEPSSQTVVFALPAPIPDPAPAAHAAIAPLTPPAAPFARAELTPSAAAILAAQASRTGAAKPLALAGGWTLAAADEEEDAAPASRSRPKKKSDVSGLVRDGRSYGEKGRFYVYAGVKNRGLGLNLTDHNGAEAGGWGADGVSYDKGGFAGQRSAGVGWRQGDVTTSLGWVHEKTNVKMVWAAPAEKDDRLAFTLSWKPSAKSAHRAP